MQRDDACAITPGNRTVYCSTVQCSTAPYWIGHLRQLYFEKDSTDTVTEMQSVHSEPQSPTLTIDVIIAACMGSPAGAKNQEAEEHRLVNVTNTF